MKTYTVKMTRTETYEYTQMVQARDEAEAQWIVENGDWCYPDEPVYAEAECDVEEVAK